MRFHLAIILFLTLAIQGKSCFALEFAKPDSQETVATTGEQITGTHRSAYVVRTRPEYATIGQTALANVLEYSGGKIPLTLDGLRKALDSYYRNYGEILTVTIPFSGAPGYTLFIAIKRFIYWGYSSRRWEYRL